MFDEYIKASQAAVAAGRARRSEAQKVGRLSAHNLRKSPTARIAMMKVELNAHNATMKARVGKNRSVSSGVEARRSASPDWARIGASKSARGGGDHIPF